MKICIVFFCAFLIALSVSGAPVDSTQARKMAEVFYNSAAKDKALSRASNNLQLIYQPKFGTVARKTVQSRNRSLTSDNDQAEFYVFGLSQQKGFVIVSGDDELSPIVGYSFEQAFKVEQMPSALKKWLDGYARYVSDVRSKATSVYRNVQPDVKTVDVVAPLLKTQWHQDAPFNKLCPNSSPAGCVAVAMAQIMNFHRWPKVGKGSGANLSFEGHVYDWENMLNVYKEDGTVRYYTDKQADAVSLLVRDFGYSVATTYWVQGSGAKPSVVLKALLDNFDYSPNVKTCWRENYSTIGWIQIIRDNLMAGHPVFYAGAGPIEGHAFVCDGIDANNFLHFNWGWEGYCDGYFDVSYLNPDMPDYNGYVNEHLIITNIYPKTKEDESVTHTYPMTITGVKLVSETPSLSATYLFSYHKLMNLSGVDFSDYYQMARVQDDGALVAAGKKSLLRLGSGQFLENNSLPVSLDITAPGTYEYVIATTSPNGLIAAQAGEMANGVILTVTKTSDGKLKGTACLNKQQGVAAVELVSVAQNEIIYENTKSKPLIVRIRNKSDVSFSRMIYSAIVPQAADVEGIDYSKFIMNELNNKVRTRIDIYGASEVNVAIPIWGQSVAGRYRIRLLYNEGSQWVILPENEPLYFTVSSLDSGMDTRDIDSWTVTPIKEGLLLDNLEQGSLVRITDVNGCLLFAGEATSQSITVPVEAKNIYLVAVKKGIKERVVKMLW